MTIEHDAAARSKRREQRQLDGKAIRNAVPRSLHAAWSPPPNRADIVEMLEASNRDRLPNLIPLRYQRLSQSPFAFYRGSTVVMAADLACLPTTNIRLQSCGDCHLQNFGWYATPERNLIFDLNDFDETCRAPWEWDLKRLVVSVVLAARELQASQTKQQELAQLVCREYRLLLADYQYLAPVEMWYARLDAHTLLKHSSEIASKKRTQQIIDAAQRRTIDRLLPKLTEGAGDSLKFKENPPLIFHPTGEDAFAQEFTRMMHEYRATLSDERRLLLDRYRVVDFAYKVVGVGSVGLRCGIILLLDPDDAPLVLQIKEARASVAQNYVGASSHEHHGHRIVHGQRVMQAASDMFLGWTGDSSGRQYYVRQLRDMKMAPNVETMSLHELEEFSMLCAWTLARGHAKSGDVAGITGYLGSGTQFDEALGAFGVAYANQVEVDFQVYQRAVGSGRIKASSGW